MAAWAREIQTISQIDLTYTTSNTDRKRYQRLTDISAFLCEVLDGEARPTAEMLDVAYCRFDNLPPLSGECTANRHLAEVYAHICEPGRQATLD